MLALQFDVEIPPTLSRRPSCRLASRIHRKETQTGAAATIIKDSTLAMAFGLKGGIPSRQSCAFVGQGGRSRGGGQKVQRHRCLQRGRASRFQNAVTAVVTIQADRGQALEGAAGSPQGPQWTTLGGPRRSRWTAPHSRGLAEEHSGPGCVRRRAWLLGKVSLWRKGPGATSVNSTRSSVEGT